MQDYSTRVATKEDKSDVSLLYEMFCDEHDLTFRKEAVDIYMNVLLDKGVCFVLETDGQVVGGISLMETHDKFSGEKVLTKLDWYVHPNHRGHGHMLLGRAESLAKELGLKELWLSAMDERTTNLLEEKDYKAWEIIYRKVID